MSGFWTGLDLVILAGVMGGSFTVPQKFVHGWAWEKTWLLYSVAGMVLVPWLIVAATIPGPAQVYSRVPLATLGLTALFGAGWGVGSVLFGLGVVRVGTALTFAIVVSLTAALGALVPLAVLHHDAMTAGRMVWLLVGMAIVIIGLILCARAGALKEAAHQAKTTGSLDGGSGRAFRRGLLICILSGVTSPMFNFSIAFGRAIEEAARREGANPATASAAVLAVAISSGFLVNAGYCLYLLVRNRSWPGNRDAAGLRNTSLALLMGLLWMFGMFAYGLGATRLGTLGPVLGWPLFMTMMVLMGNLWGTLTGEWRHAGRRAFSYLQLGNAAMVLAFVVISVGARPS